MQALKEENAAAAVSAGSLAVAVSLFLQVIQSYLLTNVSCWSSCFERKGRQHERERKKTHIRHDDVIVKNKHIFVLCHLGTSFVPSQMGIDEDRCQREEKTHSDRGEKERC